MALRLKFIVVSVLFSFFQLAFANDKAEAVHFAKKTIVLAQKTLKVEVAESDKQHEQGLMFRKNLGKDEGMLFIFKDESIRSFWMKNTLIDLSIGYFDKQKKLIDIQEMKAVTSILQQDIPVYPSNGLAMYALEMNAGWFKKNKIKLGEQFKIK